MKGCGCSCKIIYRSYGSVLHARHRGSKKDVAIKIIPVESDLKDLMKEINILKSCKCNNIVRYYGSYVKDRDLWVRVGSESHFVDCNGILCSWFHE